MACINLFTKLLKQSHVLSQFFFRQYVQDEPTWSGSVVGLLLASFCHCLSYFMFLWKVQKTWESRLYTVPSLRNFRVSPQWEPPSTKALFFGIINHQHPPINKALFSHVGWVLLLGGRRRLLDSHDGRSMVYWNQNSLKFGLPWNLQSLQAKLFEQKNM